MKVLISGTSGLIGAEVFDGLKKIHVVKALGRNLHSDFIIDFNNISEIKNQSFGDVDVFIHCASITDEDFAQDSLKAYQRSTYNYTLLLDKIIESGVKAIITFSTAHVYGRLDDIISEDYPVNPLSDYAIAHYAAEQILQRYSIQSKIKAFVIRPVAVYGIPKHIDSFKRWHLIPYSFPISCVYDQNIVLKSSGKQKRNFISTKDLCGYVEAIIANMKLFGNYTIINPVGYDTISVYEFAKKCSAIYEKLSNEECVVTRPIYSEDNTANNFNYDTKVKLYIPTDNVDDYIESFMIQLIEAYNDNIVYGKMNEL